ncbi:MAG: hypothetical protein NHG36_01360, partial [Chromatiaceae bacterium]|nr:hypothetical protein [Candidatus Thioaporhodococcus sediminis]
MNQEARARDALDDKVNRVFAGRVVRKDLVRKVKVGANVPVFVLEYLLGKYCASSDEMAIQMGLQVVNDTLADNYIRPDESIKAQSKVKENGRHTFIDKVKACQLGAIIAPPMPALYNNPQTIDDIINHSVGRVLDLFDIDTGIV